MIFKSKTKRIKKNFIWAQPIRERSYGRSSKNILHKNESENVCFIMSPHEDKNENVLMTTIQY